MSIPASVAAALAEARARIPVSEARSLLADVLGRDRVWLESHRDDPIAPELASRFAALVGRRAAGEPVAYLLGRREFYGRDFIVSPAVLIPRPETELLVEWALEAAAGLVSPRILDLGTGSGCIAVTLALERPDAQVTATDVSPEALEIARRNAARLGARVEFAHGDWFSAVGSDRFNLVVANPPYVASEDPHLRAGDLRFEPPNALASGPEGMDAIRLILAGASAHLARGGWLAIEHGFDQGPACIRAFSDAGLYGVRQMKDLAGLARMTTGFVK